jgi:hypothetical protein
MIREENVSFAYLMYIVDEVRYYTKYPCHTRVAKTFSCGKKASVVTVEVACDSCKIEFEQLFSVPPLGEYELITGMNWQTDSMAYSFRSDGDRISSGYVE